MTSPTLIKREEHSPPLRHYTISPTQSPPHWSSSPDDHHILNISIPQLPFPFPSSKSNAFCASPGLDSPSASSATSSPVSRLSSPSDSGPVPAPQRVARPCNAFMLFRSDFLRKRTIPDSIESRQQNLSRIIGQVWGLMSPAEKQPWHDLSAEAAKKHKELYPNYKFTPAPRGSRNAKNKANKDGKMPEAEISRLRELYTDVKGPAHSPPRTRRSNKSRSVEVGSRFRSTPVENATSMHTPPPSQTLSSVGTPSQSSPLRRPSTSLGFNHYSKDGTILPISYKPAQAEGVKYPECNQTMFNPHTQPFHGLDPSSYATPHFNTAMWTATNYQPSHSVSTMEAISPLTIPLPAQYSTEQPSAFAHPGLAFSQSASGSPSSLYPNYEPFYNNGTTAAGLASLGVDEDTLSFDPSVWIPDAKAMAEWDFTGYLDYNGTQTTGLNLA